MTGISPEAREAVAKAVRNQFRIGQLNPNVRQLLLDGNTYLTLNLGEAELMAEVAIEAYEQHLAAIGKITIERDSVPSWLTDTEVRMYRLNHGTEEHPDWYQHIVDRTTGEKYRAMSVPLYRIIPSEDEK